jgi:hypothetical protein
MLPSDEVMSKSGGNALISPTPRQRRRVVAAGVDGIGATYRPSAARKSGVCQQKADGRELAVVD